MDCVLFVLVVLIFLLVSVVVYGLWWWLFLDIFNLVVLSFNATRHPRHIEAAAIVMYLYLYSLAFTDHPCTLCAAVCHQAPPCPLYIQPRARQYELGVLMARKLNCLDPSGIRTHGPYRCTNVVISMVPQCFRRHIICLARPI